MKRDMDLVRVILLKLAESDNYIKANQLANDKYSRQMVGYHFQILDEAGLIVASITPAGNDPYFFAEAIRLTWEGNDFLDSIRDESIWKRVVSAIVNTTGGASLDVIKTLASSLVFEAINSGLR